MYNSFVNANIANRAGGGIEDFSGAGRVELYSMRFDGNVVNNAPGNGGALHVTGAGGCPGVEGEVHDQYGRQRGRCPLERRRSS